MVIRKAIDASLGDRIRTRRRSIGMTQADLATAIGVSFQQVQKYEKGLSSISQGRLLQICETMRLPPDFFNDDSGGYVGKAVSSDRDGHRDELQADKVMRFLAGGEGRRLVEAFMSISDHKLRTRILDFIDAIALDHTR